MTLVKDAAKTYLIEFTAVAVFYTVAVSARPWLLPLIPYEPFRLIVTVLPVVPIWLALLVVVRFYRHTDELEKLKILENVAIAAGVTACLTTTYALIEDTGLPKLGITWAWPTLAICWLISMGVQALRNR
jgi:hypothetical protein